MRLTCPLVRSCNAGAVPLYGTCTILMPVLRLNISPAMCSNEPGPVEPKVSPFGCVFA